MTESLQFAVREAIELLVNEWAYDRTERQKRSRFRLRPDELRTDGKPLAIDLPQRMTAVMTSRPSISSVRR